MTTLKQVASLTSSLQTEFYENLVSQYESSANKEFYMAMTIRRLASLASSNAGNSNPNVRMMGEMEMVALGEFILKFGNL